MFLYVEVFSALWIIQKLSIIVIENVVITTICLQKNSIF